MITIFYLYLLCRDRGETGLAASGARAAQRESASGSRGDLLQPKGPRTIASGDRWSLSQGSRSSLQACRGIRISRASSHRTTACRERCGAVLRALATQLVAKERSWANSDERAALPPPSFGRSAPGSARTFQVQGSTSSLPSGVGRTTRPTRINYAHFLEKHNQLQRRSNRRTAAAGAACACRRRQAQERPSCRLPLHRCRVAPTRRAADECLAFHSADRSPQGGDREARSPLRVPVRVVGRRQRLTSLALALCAGRL